MRDSKRSVNEMVGYLEESSVGDIGTQRHVNGANNRLLKFLRGQDVTTCYQFETNPQGRRITRQDGYSEFVNERGEVWKVRACHGTVIHLERLK